MEAEFFKYLMRGYPSSSSRITDVIYIPSLNITIVDGTIMNFESRLYSIEADKIQMEYLRKKDEDIDIKELENMMLEEHLKHVKKISISIEDINKIQELNTKLENLKHEIKLVEDDIHKLHNSLIN